MTQRTYLHILALFCVAVVICFIIFQDGFPVGYDYKNQIISYEAVSVQMHDGEIYPRWLADVNKGYGSTNLFFYPPFTYYSAFLIDAVTGFSLSTGVVLSFNAFLLVFLSGISFFIFARALASPNLSLLAAILYIMLPYHTWFEIYERNAIAELSAYIWIPLIFHCIRSALLKKPKYMAGLSFSYALLILSHLPTAIFASGFVTVFAAMKIIDIKNAYDRLRYSATFIILLALGAGISGLYLYPAVSLLEQTNSDYLWEGFYDYNGWFLSFDNHCPIADACTHLFLIAVVQIFIPLLFFALLIIKGKTSHIKKEATHFIVLATLCFFLVTSLSSSLWDILWPLQKIQFPWRLLVMSDFLFVAVIISALSGLTLSSRKMPVLYILSGVSGLCLIALTIIIALYAQSSWAPPTHKFDDSIASKMLTEEHIPKNKNFTNTYRDLQKSELAPLWTVMSGQADIEVLSKTPRSIEIQVQAQEAFTLQVRQFYFFGWKVKQNNKDITHDVNLRDAKPYGQLEMDLPKGNYPLHINLETLPQEKTGFLISLTSLLFLIMLVSVKFRRVSQKSHE